MFLKKSITVLTIISLFNVIAVSHVYATEPDLNDSDAWVQYLENTQNDMQDYGEFEYLDKGISYPAIVQGAEDDVIKVMIDPGHHAYENISPVNSAYYESVMTWKLSNYLQEELRALGVQADLSKSSLEAEPSLQDRGRCSAGYDFFISIHSNASGYEYVDYPVAICYQNLDWTTIDDTSREIGALLADKVAEVMGTNQAGTTWQRKSDNDRDGNGVLDDEWYGVLCGSRYVGTPGVLMEHSFHTNRRATAWLLEEQNLHNLAKEEAQVIKSYFQNKKDAEKPKTTTTTTVTTTEITTSETVTTTTTTNFSDPIPRDDGIIGDVDGNGEVEVDDASRILNYYAKEAAGLKPKFLSYDDEEGEKLIFKVADVDGDNEISVDDASLVLEYYAKKAAGLI